MRHMYIEIYQVKAKSTFRLRELSELLFLAHPPCHIGASLFDVSYRHTKDILDNIPVS